MQIVYYIRKDGTIRGFHKIYKIADEDIPRVMEKYNTENPNGETACVFYAQPGSIEEYLIKRATENIHLQIDVIRELHNALQDAETQAYELLCEAERQGVN